MARRRIKVESIRASQQAIGDEILDRFEFEAAPGRKAMVFVIRGSQSTTQLLAVAKQLGVVLGNDPNAVLIALHPEDKFEVYEEGGG